MIRTLPSTLRRYVVLGLPRQAGEDALEVADFDSLPAALEFAHGLRHCYPGHCALLVVGRVHLVEVRRALASRVYDPNDDVEVVDLRVQRRARL
jgi:hypothetical protein